MPHRPDTWTDALFIYPLYHVNFLTSFMEWFRFFFSMATENNTAISVNVVGSKHKAKRQGRKFTWDFYEQINQNQSCLEKTIGCN